MARIWYVDIPRMVEGLPGQGIDGEDDWVNVSIEHSREDAERVLLERWGIEKEQAGVFITDGEDYELEGDEDDGKGSVSEMREGAGQGNVEV